MSHEELQNLHLQKLVISEDGTDSDTNHNLVVAKNGQIISSYSHSVKDNPHHAKDMTIHWAYNLTGFLNTILSMHNAGA